ncbi:SDR family NAD(P)-dependent oxidoreductase [Alphaproteobacteria bacterium]|nr:SDR family NAD(P)-dependent oxidoreductase [Alphaproteobacteria bacterium]
MQRNLKDKVVWITGAGGGMGQHIALTLSKLHSKVILSNINEQSLKKVSQKCTYYSSIKPLDITKINHVKTVVKEIENDYGQLGIVINAAGMNIQNRDWDQVFKVNINGMFYCCKFALKLMKKQNDELIINISSWAGNHISYLSGTSYIASKHAINAMTETINMKYCNVGIRACSICPGEASTPLLDQRPVPLSQEEKDLMLQVEDISETGAFIAQREKHVCVNQITISPTHNRLYL